MNAIKILSKSNIKCHKFYDFRDFREAQEQKTIKNEKYKKVIFVKVSLSLTLSSSVRLEGRFKKWNELLSFIIRLARFLSYLCATFPRKIFSASEPCLMRVTSNEKQIWLLFLPNNKLLRDFPSRDVHDIFILKCY